jgi:hypothetical protein
MHLNEEAEANERLRIWTPHQIGPAIGPARANHTAPLRTAFSARVPRAHTATRFRAKL